MWATRAVTAVPAVPELSTPMSMSGKMANRLRAVVEAELPPALPESPEVIMRAHRPLPPVPVNGTRPGTTALGLALRPSLSVHVLPSGLPTPPIDSPTWTADSPKSWTSNSINSDSPKSWTQDVTKPIHAQPLPPLPPCKARSLGRKLPATLTESLELLVRVQEHCHKLGGAPTSSLGAVPEEPLSTSPPRNRRDSHPGPPPAIRRLVEPAYASCINLQAVPEGATVPTSLHPSRPPRRVTAPAQLQRTRSASSDSSSSGDWPETPPTSVYAGHSAGAESVPVFSSLPEDMRRRPPMRSVVALDQYPLSSATLAYAAELELLDEAGRSLRFGDVLSSKRTLVVFVRHWLSPSCAAYLRELIAALSPAVLARAHARVVFVGHGAANLISGFRQHLQCPFTVYTDPTRRLHDVLGLVPKGSKGFHFGRAKDLFMGAARIGLRSGNRAQMGGLFVFDGQDIGFAHRMRGDGDHAPLAKVLEAVSLRPAPLPPVAGSKAPLGHRSSVYISRPGPSNQPRGAQSCTALIDPPQRLVFPLPPSSQNSQETRKRRLSAQRDAVAVVYPDDIARVSCEMRGLRV
ncbi:uncharacterized protein CcaverHIS019_0407080 [Cutaneotrichosporon cavernicola]|uniref:Thioredoxin domain-containing protein n=1 Tax=Cutaneotrichosporon cavernicola TaxID=279322 RepID=A0AA48L4Q0_9TREE|nr:uncharacterized protein CcaverHIS019_0407080 [Cutaneotrichosporon cavernicola]BEI91888.1 hypothetical protein CcaverHIS019_0407080 [Cutaneotrichosporon cavernicola]